MDRRAWWATVHRVAKSLTQCVHVHTHTQTLKLVNGRNSLVVQWLRICLLILEMQVQSLVGELRSHMLWDNKACALQLKNLCTATTELTCSTAHVPQQEKPIHHNQSSPSTPVKTQCSQKINPQALRHTHSLFLYSENSSSHAWPSKKTQMGKGE